jgi:hypothetical protein
MENCPQVLAGEPDSRWRPAEGGLFSWHNHLSGASSYRHSEPAVYEIWQRQIPLIERYIAPKQYFQSMDEVRSGGFCEACKRRHLNMAQILGDSVTRQHDMIRAVNPQAQVYVWSDMFDPNHNAVAKYYLIDGSFEGSWNYIPKDLSIACWYFEKRDQSLEFFSKRGHTIRWVLHITTPTIFKIRRIGSARWTGRPAPPGSCTRLGKTNTSCSPPSAIWSPRGNRHRRKCSASSAVLATRSQIRLETTHCGGSRSSGPPPAMADQLVNLTLVPRNSGATRTG